jgi:tripartite-type tricarboxylate transporter receptor subunit TctC
MLKKIFCLLVGMTLVAGAAGLAFAQETFPDSKKPITIYVGYKLGATTGVTATVIGKCLEETLKSPVAIVDKSGATATLALGTVARLPADGYSLAVGSYSTILSGPYEYKLPYDTQKDIDPLYAYTMYHAGFAVMADSPWKTMRDYLDWAKANPGKAKWGSTGAMTLGHLVLEYIGYKEKIDWRPMGTQGGAATTKLLLGGQTNGLIMSGSQIPLIRKGQLRLLADFAPPSKPLMYEGYVKPEDMKNVSTLDKLGYGDLAFVNPVIFFARTGLKPEVRKKLIDAIQKATYDKKFLEMTDKFDMPAVHDGGDDFFKKTREPFSNLTVKILKDMGRIK